MSPHRGSVRLLPLLFLFTGTLHSGIHFADVTTSAGLTGSVVGEGVCVFDYDNDGLPDIFIAGFDGRSLLYHNLGNLQFEESAAAAGVDSVGRARTPVAADVDNDGLTDLLVACFQDPTRLFRNLGNGTFQDVTDISGIQNSDDAHGSAWFDCDADGKLDLYVGNLTAANVLYRNDGNGSFTDIASSVGAQGPMPSGLVMGLTVVDYDRDGDGDILMAQDGDRGNFLLRQEMDGSYTDVSEQAGVVIPVQGMGVAIGDYNRDGFFDFYTTNLDESTLFRNNGDGTFSDVTVEAGVGDQPAHMGWGTFFFDADNDGWPDLYNNNQTGFGGIPNSFFRNRGDGTFEDLSSTSGLQSYNDGIGSAFADFDNDGDIDIILSGHPSAAGNLKLFRNDSDDPNHWIQLVLHQDGDNGDAIGALVELYAAGDLQLSMVSAGGGFLSENTFVQHFGLGQAAQADSVVVHWPNGLVEWFADLTADARYTLNRGSGTTDVAGGAMNPDRFRLEQNYPNPFNPLTTITYVNSRRQFVDLKIYNILGREIATLVSSVKEPGSYSVQWDATGEPSGVYFYRLNTEGTTAVRRMVLLK